MSTQRNTIALLLALAASGLGCTAEPLTDGTAGGVNADPDRLCVACHGTGGQNAAPPHAVNGDTATASMAVGAHQTHLKGGTVHKAFACSDCHPVPEVTHAEGHRDGRVQLAWSPLATTGGATPSFDRESGTCSSTYCHGDVAEVRGGLHTRPIWNVVDGSQKACDSCHGFPPPAPHPTGGRCADCHGGTVNAANQIDLAGGKHLNGRTDFGDKNCYSCHGSPPSPAPAQGAHAAHLREGLSKALTCAECHPMPASGLETVGHGVARPAEMAWGRLATTGGATPALDRQTGTCSSTYCHGSASPVWTTVDGSQSTCASCHGAPPSTGKHAVHARFDCSSCHDGVATRTTIVDPSKHVDGKADVEIRGGGTFANGSCSAMLCHGELSW